MKIKLAIDSPIAQVRIRAKSRAKRTKLLTESMHKEEPSYISPVTLAAKNMSSDKEKVKSHRQRSCSKLHCEHKKKKSKEKHHENEYYNVEAQRREWQRERDQLLRENDKLRRQNKVLNDYFTYLECKDVLASRDKQKVFSFKQVQEFHGGESKTHKTSITKPSSKMQYLEQFY